MTIKCILFDADGVVINSGIFSTQYQKKYSISKNEMIPFFKGEFQKCIIGKADLIETVKPWLPKWKWTGTVEEFLQFWFKAEHSVDDRIIKIINNFRKKTIKCCLATNQEKYRTQYIKKQMGFDELFDHIFSSVDIGYKKPEKNFYEFVLNKIKNDYKIYPNEILFFDDSQENIDVAKEIGINAYFYKNFEDFENIVKSILERNV